MAFTTYYRPSSGQPQCNNEKHETFADALAAWESNCDGLLKASGGSSVLLQGMSDLVTWHEYASGPCVSGSWVARTDVSDDYHEVARRIREREAIEA